MYITSKLLLIYRTWTKSNHNSRTSLKYNLVWSFLCSPCRLSVYFAEWNNNSNMLFCKKDIIQNKQKKIAHQTCKYQRTFLSCYSDNNSWRNQKTFSKTRDILFHKTWNMSHFQASIGVKKKIFQGFAPTPLGDPAAAFWSTWLRSAGFVDGYHHLNSIPVLAPGREQSYNESDW